MADLQEIFNKCKNIYEHAYTLIKDMATAVAEVLREDGKDFDPSITTGKFDVVLQYSLLQVAAADNDLDSNEIIYIRDLTKQADLLNFLNNTIDSNYTWEGIYNSNVYELNSFLKAINDPMISVCKEIVDVFVLCDKATKVDYYTGFSESILALVQGVMLMDGEITNSEKQVGILILGMLNDIENQLRK